MPKLPYTHEWYVANKERIRRAHRKYYYRTKKRWAVYAKRWRKNHSEQVRTTRRKYYQRNKVKIFEQVKAYNRAHPEWAKQQRKLKLARWKAKYPIRFALCKRLSIIRQRCKNPKYKDYPRYGGKGIRCFLTIKEIESLWYRDDAQQMRWPSLDRINPERNYTLSNCRFIEFTENISRASKRRWLRIHRGTRSN